MDSESGVFSMTFDQSGSRLITTEADKTIKIYKEDESAVSIFFYSNGSTNLSIGNLFTVIKHYIASTTWIFINKQRLVSAFVLKYEAINKLKLLLSLCYVCVILDDICCHETKSNKRNVKIYWTLK